MQMESVPQLKLQATQKVVVRFFWNTYVSGQKPNRRVRSHLFSVCGGFAERKNEDAFERLMDGSMGHIPPIVEICHYEHLRLIFLFLIISVHEENGCTRSPQFVIVWVRPNWDCFQKQAGCVRLLQRDLWASYRFKLGSPLKTFISKTVNGGVTMWDLPRLHRLSVLLANSCAHNSSLAIPWGAGHMCPCCP